MMNILGANEKTIRSPDKATQVEVAVILCVTIAAFWLRVRNIGLLGFAGDEELTGLAVAGLKNLPYPSMPSGMPYLRALPFSFTVFLSQIIFGTNEFAARFPSVVFSVCKIPLIFFLARRLFNKEVAFISIIITTFALWDINVSRTARMYSMFSFFYLLCLLTYYLGFIEGRKFYIIATPIIFLFTTSIHTLGLFFAPLFLLPLFLPDYHIVKKTTAILIFAGSAAAGFVIKILTNLPYSIYLNRGVAATAAVAKPSNDSIIVRLVKHLVYEVHLPAQELLSHLLRSGKPIFLSIVLILIFLVIFMIYKKYPPFENRYNITISLLLIVMALLQLYGIAMLCLFFHLYKTGEGYSVLRQRNTVVWSLFIGLTMVCWIIYGLLVWRASGYNLDGQQALMLKTVKSLLYYPPLDLRHMLVTFPKMSLLTLGASVFLFIRFTMNKSDLKLIFPVFAFFIPALLAGFLKEWTASRYFFNLYPIFIMLYAFAIVELSKLLIQLYHYATLKTKVGLSGSNIQRWMLYGACLLLVGVTVEHAFPGTAIKLNRINYGGDSFDSLDGFSCYPDHKGAAMFIKDRIKSGDIVIAEDPYQQFFYIGQVDYRIKSEGVENTSTDYNGMNIYTNSRRIYTLEQLKEIIGKNRTWLITSGEMSEKYRRKYIGAEVVDFLNKSASHRLFKGRDGQTTVYYFESKIS